MTGPNHFYQFRGELQRTITQYHKCLSEDTTIGSPVEPSATIVDPRHAITDFKLIEFTYRMFFIFL